MEIEVVLDDAVDFMAYDAVFFEWRAPGMRSVACCAALVLADQLLVVQYTPLFLMAGGACPVALVLEAADIVAVFAVTVRGRQVTAPGVEHPLVTVKASVSDYFDLCEVRAMTCSAIGRMAGNVVDQYGFTGIVARAAEFRDIFSLAMGSVARDTRPMNLFGRVRLADDIAMAFSATGFARNYRALMRLVAPLAGDVV